METPTGRHRKILLAMEAAVILFCLVFLFIGLTVAKGLDSFALEWGVKIVAVGLLAVSWLVIPKVYETHLREIVERREKP
jgi:hypothetical protein